jgi:hypothetical protein
MARDCPASLAELDALAHAPPELLSSATIGALLHQIDSQHQQSIFSFLFYFSSKATKASLIPFALENFDI